MNAQDEMTRRANTPRASDDKIYALSDRLLQTLWHIERGDSPKVIAAEMQIKYRTVVWNVGMVAKRLGFSSALELRRAHSNKQ